MGVPQFTTVVSILSHDPKLGGFSAMTWETRSWGRRIFLWMWAKISNSEWPSGSQTRLAGKSPNYKKVFSKWENPYKWWVMYVLDGNFGALPNCSARSFKESKSWSMLEVPFWRCVDPWSCRSLLYLWPLHLFIHTHFLCIYLCMHILIHIHMHILITHECKTWWWYSRKTTVLIHQCFSHLLHIPGLAINHHVEKT